MVDDAELLAWAEALVAAYAAAGRTIVTAESCTGGLVAGLLTAVPGSSAVLERGFVTYSNEAKAEAIGVPMDLIRRNGAVSEPVARAMATGALAASRAAVAVAVTGIAGGGPAGMMAGLLFARAGLDVTVLEKHADFLRDFRGDTIHPSTLDLMDELGLSERFRALPQRRVESFSGVVAGRGYRVADF